MTLANRGTFSSNVGHLDVTIDARYCSLMAHTSKLGHAIKEPSIKVDVMRLD